MQVEGPPIGPVAEPRGLRAAGTTWMIVGSLIGAVAAYGFQAVGGRSLGSVSFAPVSVLWTLLFILGTVILVPLEQYATRETSLGRSVLGRDLRTLVTVTTLGAAVAVVFVAATLRPLFEGDPVFILQAGLMLTGYGILFSAKGILAGRRRFAGVGWVLFWESTIRLVAGVLVLQISATPQALGWAMVVGPYSSLGLRFWRHDRGGDGVPRAEAGGGFLRAYIGGSAASQLLLGGAPLGVAALHGGPALVSVVFITFTLYRAPLTIIYNLQGRLLPALVRMASDRNEHGLRRYAAWILAGGAALTAAAWWVGSAVGPGLVEALFSADFRPAAGVAALAAAGVVAASTTQVAGQTLVARGRTGLLAGTWSAGLLTALVLLVVGVGTPDHAVAVAFAGGAVVSLASMAVLTLRTPRG